MPYRYVPLLRSKLGEAIALAQLSNPARSRVLPLMHLMPKVPDRFLATMQKGWAGRPLALDGLYNRQATGSATTYVDTYRVLERLGIQMLPSIEVGAPATYQTVVQRLMAQSQRGAVIRALLRDLPTLTAWMTSFGVVPTEADLVIDVGPVSTFDPAQIAMLATQVLQQNLPTPNDWRSVTLASSAAPQTLGGRPAGQSYVPRLDWRLWNAVAPSAPCALDYGDYGTVGPGLDEPPWFAVTRAPISVRYTLDDDWLILKGAPVTGPNAKPMESQLRSHARTLTRHPQFAGVANCVADNRIRNIATGNGGPGSRQSWVEIA